MGNMIDTTFCLDGTLLMTPDFDQVKETIQRVLNRVLVDGQNSARLGLIQFQLHHDYPMTMTNAFTQNRNSFEQLLNAQQPQGRGGHGEKAVGEALREVFNFEWRDNNDNEICPEKLVILLTDGAPNGLFGLLHGEDPWVVSNQLREQNITLVVVGVGGSIVACDDFYCALAQNTGGIYIPWINAERILWNVITWVLGEESTLNQAFRHVMMEAIEENSLFKYSYMKSRVDGMIKECKTMDDIRRLFFNHRLSS